MEEEGNEANDGSHHEMPCWRVEGQNLRDCHYEVWVCGGECRKQEQLQLYMINFRCGGPWIGLGGASATGASIGGVPHPSQNELRQVLQFVAIVHDHKSLLILWFHITSYTRHENNSQKIDRSQIFVGKKKIWLLLVLLGLSSNFKKKIVTGQKRKLS